MALNILYIIDSLTDGGTEKQVVELISNLERSSFQPHLCTLKPSRSLFDELDLPKICLNFRSFTHPSILSCMRKLIGFIRLHEIHVAQTFFQDPTLLAALIKPFGPKIKLVGSFRDLGFWRTPSETRKMRLAYRMFDAFLANSNAVKDHFALTDNILPDRISVIYNGIDLKKFELTKRKRTSGTRVGIVANLNRPVKRVQDFIEAAAILHRDMPDVRFVIIGDGHLRGRLEGLSRSLGLTNVLQFAGSISNPLPMIQEFDVGVLTSETEGFSNAILEYMAFGIPVVATRAGGNTELVQDGGNGFLYEVGDTAGLAGKIKHLLQDAALSAAISENNEMKIRESFSLETMILQYQAVQRSIVGGGFSKEVLSSPDTNRDLSNLRP